MPAPPITSQSPSKPSRCGRCCGPGFTDKCGRGLVHLSICSMSDKANIFLVDDKPDKLLALEVVLSDLDANLVRATSGREALRHLLNQEFAVILLDVNMPSMDGFETAGLIRQRKSSQHVPIIFITAM